MRSIDILNQYNFYAQLTANTQKALANTGTHCVLRAGDFFFHEGDACSQVALIGRGDIRVYKSAESGREITLYHVASGETCVLTTTCFLTASTYPASAIAEEETEAILFPAPQVRRWFAEDETLRQFFLETLARRMSHVMALVEEVAFNRMDRRLAERLLRRFAQAGTTTDVLETTHEQLAAELGSAREVISRLLKELERSGAIELARGRIVLRDQAILRRFAEKAH